MPTLSDAFLKSSSHKRRKMSPSVDSNPSNGVATTAADAAMKGAIEQNATIQNPLRNALLAGRVTSSLSLRICRTIEIAMIAKTAGYEGLFIDMEHSSFDLDTAGQLSIACLYAGITPIVRVPSNDSFFISRACDGGALAIVVPHIRTLEDGKRAVDAAKFPPIGKRSATAGLPQLQFRGLPAHIASPACNEATLVILMVETVEALEIVDELAALAGVDMLLIGTNDLTAELGIAGQYDEPVLKEAYAKVIAACRRHGKWVGSGGLHTRIDKIEEFCRMGVNYVMAGADMGFILEAGGKRANEMKAIDTLIQGKK
jgi:2-keto-3-deoxy-L-rhamnonate aldolase RhmA